MSIIDELLVLLDDQKEPSLDEIKNEMPNKSKQSISSALGRLSSKGWIKCRNFGDDKLYKISSNGRKEITNTLNKIRFFENHKWDGSWLLVVFSIPEKMRRARDIFRVNLINAGFARLHNDLWISFWNHRNVIENKISALNITNYTTIFKIDSLSNHDLNSITNNLSWNSKELNKLYKKFISNTKKFLANKKKGVYARILVYEFAKTLAIDPVFPKEIIPENYLLPEAYKMYLKIRPHCYN